MDYREQKNCAGCNQLVSPLENRIDCSDCSRTYHLSCWEQNNRCADPGCTGRPIYQPAAKSNQRSCPYCQNIVEEGANYCRYCGRTIGDGGKYAGPSNGPGHTGSHTYYNDRPHVENYLVWAILATIFCCMPFGIVAIVYAAQVNGFLAAGNYAAAQNASETARKWTLASFLTGLAIPMLYMLFFGFAACLGAFQ